MAGLMERFTPTDWYEDGRARRYRDNETMEDISLHEYRKRKRAEATIDDDPDDVDELQTQALPDTPPPPRERPVFEQEPRGGAVRRLGLAEMLAPAVAGFAASVAMIRLRDRPAVYMVPPSQVTQPILRPLGRMIDRRLIMNLAFMDTEDGKDLAEILGALAAGGFWFTEALENYEAAKAERYAQYVEQNGGYERRGSSSTQPGSVPGSNGRVHREATPAPAAASNDWAEDIRRRVYGGRDAAVDAVRANGATDVPALDILSPNAATQRLADLYTADAEGVKRRGLDIGR